MRPALFFAFLALLASAGGAFAQRRGDGVLPLDRILPEVRRSHPGQFYDADGPRPGPDGRAQYRLKWMRPEGRVEWLDADARTGRVLGPGQGSSAPRGQQFEDRPRGFEPRNFNGDGGGGYRDFGRERFDRGDGSDRRDRYRRGR